MQHCRDCPDPARCATQPICVGVGGFAPRLMKGHPKTADDLPRYPECGGTGFGIFRTTDTV